MLIGLKCSEKRRRVLITQQFSADSTYLWPTKIVIIFNKYSSRNGITSGQSRILYAAFNDSTDASHPTLVQKIYVMVHEKEN